MLKLVLGGSGSGKTTLLYARIKARAEAGQRSILLVPEQFTSSPEGRIYRELGDALSGMVDSYSFTSLAEHILSAEGGAAVQTLSDAGRAVLVRRTLEELQDTVQYYYRHRRSAAFCQMAAETIDELKSAGLSGQQLYRLAQGCGSGSGKLTELALILQGYETLLAGTGMDPSDRLELAAEYMLDNLFVRRLEADDILPLHEEKCYLLVETSYFNPPMRLLSMLKHIQEKGYHPLLAHPERYEYMQMADYKALQQAGEAFQLNIPSLAGMYGRHVQKKAEALQEAGMYTLRGNDTHSLIFFQNLLNEKIRK